MPRFSPTVVDHFTNPRNSGRLAHADVTAFIGNPVCGDQILLSAQVRDDAVSEIGFEAYGCSASLAVASILTERLSGMPVGDIAAIEATQVTEWSGGLSPEQQHVAALGADVAQRLANNYRNGIHEDVSTIPGS
ncbi:iron-sulfur cluster assembly scaffold protein [Mycobacteroides franklinii]|uniref:Iron-sulfur cluster assembly scaffold protein n=1 Tax=Mycobacteroides franklinii TaxID=948102 RepID=A0A1S1L8E2_9MYCO|nr:iron-sulfur cluster assembly scaffold protein [Mycobacteroides franklinii]NGX10322.1 nitrogen fixation protein NifU [Mycobacteroides franklinii]OHU21403.1 iron-sulfur cluster assembly scaffold protein [Mycobacteroides franklinii]ORA64593.1 iron-sulfur cluster assembly scaffold protein [Mycobacteroides franklinii]TDH22679.1 iron-sulfur cluster assembly scaffold protein [Mycobacteroides franklinii]